MPLALSKKNTKQKAPRENNITSNIFESTEFLFAKRFELLNGRLIKKERKEKTTMEKRTERGKNRIIYEVSIENEVEPVRDGYGQVA